MLLQKTHPMQSHQQPALLFPAITLLMLAYTIGSWLGILIRKFTLNTSYSKGKNTQKPMRECFIRRLTLHCMKMFSFR